MERIELNPNIPYYIEKEGDTIVIRAINKSGKKSDSMPFSILKHCESMFHEVEDDFIGFCQKYDEYVRAHGDRFYEQVYFEEIPFPECSDYSLSMNVRDRKVNWFSINTKNDICGQC